MNGRRPGNKRQRGAVLIFTLWTVTLMTILVAALAAQVRLSAHAVFYQQEDLQAWADQLSALNQAEMMILLEKMPPPPGDSSTFGEDPRARLYRFDGRLLPVSEQRSVRIWDHAGKINLDALNGPRLRALLEKRLGAEASPERIAELVSAWNDWHDLNDLAGINGAESDHYQQLPQPYAARNGRFETVEELLLIRGFAELFADVDLDAAFTLYGEERQLNLNLATVEALRLLPGLDEALIREIIAFRTENIFQGNGDVARLVPAENMALLRPWLSSRRTSDFYTVMVYPKGAATGDNSPVVDPPTHAFAITVRIADFNSRPRVLRVNPYQTLPLRPETLLEE